MRRLLVITFPSPHINGGQNITTTVTNKEGFVLSIFLFLILTRTGYYYLLSIGIYKNVISLHLISTGALKS